MEGDKSKMKRPMEDIYGSDPAEGFHRGKNETKEHYRALLRIADEHRKSESAWHQASCKAECIAAKMDLLHAIIGAKGDFDYVAELAKLTEKHMEAERKLGDVKVKVPDWFKLDEPWLLDE